jgi:hypothetical protein
VGPTVMANTLDSTFFVFDSIPTLLMTIIIEPGFKTRNGKGFNITYGPKTPSRSQSVATPVTPPQTPVGPVDPPSSLIATGNTTSTLKRQAEEALPAQEQPTPKQFRLLADPGNRLSSATASGSRITTRRSAAAASISGKLDQAEILS